MLHHTPTILVTPPDSHGQVTVDAQRLGRREADDRNRFTLPPHLQLVRVLCMGSSHLGSAWALLTLTGLCVVSLSVTVAAVWRL